MSQTKLTKAEVADRFGESSKQIERYVAEGIPCEGSGHHRLFLWPECRNWRDERLKRLERERIQRDQPLDFEKARSRKMDAEAREAELRVERMLGTVVPLEEVERVIGALCDRLLPILQNLPSNYALRLEELGVEVKQAEMVLESIATELTVALRASADELTDDSDADAGDTVDNGDNTTSDGDRGVA